MIFNERHMRVGYRMPSIQHAVYFIAEIVLKSKAVVRFKLHHELTVTCSEIGNKTYRCPLASIGQTISKAAA